MLQFCVVTTGKLRTQDSADLPFFGIDCCEKRAMIQKISAKLLKTFIVIQIAGLAT